MIAMHRAALVLVIVALTTASAQSTVFEVNSGAFSLGYGFSIVSGSVGGWQTTETSGNNTPTTQGDFSFVPAVAGGQFDSTGPGFPGRVLTSGTGFTGVSIAYSTEAGFSASILGSYLGALPAGTNHRVRVNISQISIYGVAHPSFVAGNEDFALSETTPGNTGTSAVLPLTPTGAYTVAGNYTHLVWNPGEFEDVGVTSLRSFVLLSDDLRGIDGFEIIGSVTLLFDSVVPEPGVGSLLGLGALGLAWQVRRRTPRTGKIV